MKIADNKVVHLSYQLTIDGQIADKATAEKPDARTDLRSAPKTHQGDASL